MFFRSTVTQHLLGFLGSGCLLSFGLWLSSASQLYWVQRPREDEGRISPAAVKLLSFGQAPVVTDWLWIRFLVDPSIAHAQKGVRAAVFRDLDLATDLDSKFFEAYIYGANILTVIRDDNEGAHALLSKAQTFRKQKLSQLPDAFREEFWSDEFAIPLTLAYVYIYELDDLPRGAEAFKEAAQLPKAPAYLQSLVEKLKTTEGQIEVGLGYTGFLAEMFKSNPEALERLERRKRGLVAFQYLYGLNKGYLSFLKNHPRYRASVSPTDDELLRYFREYLAKIGNPGRDPWGGVLSLNSEGKIISTTEYQAFGMKL
jgi:hypothetical protein